MTYFNPAIYCKQNLKEKDKVELDYWHDIFINLIDNAAGEYLINEKGGSIIQKIKQEIVDDFCEELKEQLGVELQENVVSIIDGYEMAVDMVEQPDTYFYNPED